MTEAGKEKKTPAPQDAPPGEDVPEAVGVGAADESSAARTGESSAEEEPGGTAAASGVPAEAGLPTAALRAELGQAQAEPGTGGDAAPPAGEEPSADEPSRGPSPARIEYDDATLTRCVEAVLFVSQHPLTVAQVARPLRTTFAAVRRAFRAIADAYAERGVRLTEVGGGYQFRTAPECADAVRRFLDVRPLRLSKAAMETLAVIAYRQPVTKPDVDEIRGVDSGSAIKLLLDRNLVRVLGRKEEPGRPLLYGTTQAFLEFFNLPSLSDLPSLREYAELTEDGRRQLERDLFARSPDVLAPDEGGGGRVRPARRWEDLVEVLGDDLGGLPEGVEIEVEPSDPLEAYVRDETFPRPPPAEGKSEEGLDGEAAPDEDPSRAGGAADGDEPAAGSEMADDDGTEDVPDNEDRS